MPAVSFVISFYKNIRFLELIIAGLEIQSFRDFEVIIADDGSPASVRDTVARMIRHSPLSMNHIWHADNGFRKTRIFNRAIQISHADYLVFTDGDCIPHPKFIEEHYRNKADRVALTGRRVNLSERISRAITPEQVKSGALQGELFRKLMVDGVRRKARNVEMGIYFKNGLLRQFFNRKDRGILGCNMSFNKSDLIAVNGFDERYQAPATGEDSDIEFRLRLNGIRVKTLKHMAILYHRHHRKLARGEANMAIYNQTIKRKLIVTPYGLMKSESTPFRKKTDKFSGYHPLSG